MTFDPDNVRNYLKTANFKKLFVEELGWDNPPVDQQIMVDGEVIPLKAVAEKRGMVVFTCGHQIDGKLPDSNLRRKIDTQLTKYVREHLIVFVTNDNARQEWQWVRREPGKPLALRTASFTQGQSGQALIQKLRGLYFSLDEEEGLTNPDVTNRVRATFDVEKVTKKFYDDFKKKHEKFLSFINGIPDEEFKRWYASVMLNRLMFIYFLQKKHFLDNDDHYLRTGLEKVKAKNKGSYYKTFLCPLFFEGFAKKEKNRSKEARELLGKIPYLNGGLFLKHQVEERYGDKIEIPDKAFEDLFAFFDLYQWHLDERPLKRDNEINPDVLGYIFEKYINQKQMGAYYTKEDITEYISKNTIIPWLFSAASKKCEIAFDKGSYLWKLLKSNPDKYIYPAVRHGIGHDLPANIAAGVDDVSKRTDWNKSAPMEYALPTEIWREVIARRQRYEEIKAKITGGEIQSIEDFITYNLDMRQFARDVIDGAEGPELVRAFWKALEEITVLDPACGSGAFLFAALNILEDLYDSCLDRMQSFVSDLDSSGDGKSAKLKDFRETLERIASHPNEKYFVYKSIIIQNLFGVDIMEEATEICKLRLFLKLAAQLESPEKIEPLPDIDFNIKAGNSLIGYTSAGDVRKAIERNGFDFDNSLDKIRDRAEDLDAAFTAFRRQQTELGGEVTPEDKDALKARLKALEEELNRFLAKDYGIDLDKNTDLEKSATYQKWKHDHKPFHWWIEFYGIMNDGGFDVIVGNPPYLETREVDYQIHGLETYDTKAIHVMFIEVSSKILNKLGSFSMIVPLALVSTQRMKIAQDLIEKERSAWYANYAWRPGKLFDTVNRALTIFVATSAKNRETMATNYQKWNSDSRAVLMHNLRYASVERERKSFWVPKIADEIENSILDKIKASPTSIAHFLSKTDHKIYYRTTGGLYWKVFTDFAPKFFLNEKPGSSSRETTLSVSDKGMIYPLIAALSSDVFWYWYTITSNLRDLNPSDIQGFPLPKSALEDKALIEKGKAYVKDLDRNSQMLVRQQKKTGKTETQSFKIQKSKPIIEEIDRILAKHYGFTDEELDFIINYDIKYRLGADDGEDE